MATILAVAIAERSDEVTIKTWKDLKGLRGMKVRPYLRGLVQGLDELNARLGNDYEIVFRQRDATSLDPATFTAPTTGQPYVIFCMSTTVVKAAAAQFPSASSTQPIVGVVSEPAREGVGLTANLCGISARRVQTADDCFKRFRRAVPSLQEVRVLHKVGYGPSERALAKVNTAAGTGLPGAFPVTTLLVTTAANLMTALQSLPARDIETTPATLGIQVLPIDVCLGNAQEIINYVQQDRGLPTFFPVPDWVRPDELSALGAYGLSQRRSGALMAQQVKAIWDNNGEVPSSFSTVNDRWIPAPPHDFEFLVSAAAADSLNIKLHANIPRV